MAHFRPRTLLLFLLAGCSAADPDAALRDDLWCEWSVLGTNLSFTCRVSPVEPDPERSPLDVDRARAFIDDEMVECHYSDAEGCWCFARCGRTIQEDGAIECGCPAIAQDGDSLAEPSIVETCEPEGGGICCLRNDQMCSCTSDSTSCPEEFQGFTFTQVASCEPQWEIHAYPIEGYVPVDSCDAAPWPSPDSEDPGDPTTEDSGPVPMTPQECFDAYLYERGSDCTVADCGGSPLLTCVNQFDCTTCSDVCMPPACTTDEECQTQFGDLCPGVRWICDQYQLDLACTVDFG